MFKPTLGKVEKNAAWVIGCKFGQAVLSFIISMFTARYLGPGNYGLLSYAISVVAFFVPFAGLGISNILVKEFVQNPDDEGKILGTSLLSTFITSVLCIIGAVSFVSVTNAGESEKVLVCALYSVMIIFQSMEITGYWFLSKLNSKITSVISLAAYLLVSAYKIFLLATEKSVEWFALSYSIDYAVISVLQFIFYKKNGGQRLSFSFETAKHLFDQGKHYILSSLMVVVFASTDKVMITYMLGNEYNGYYSAAVTIAGMLSFVFSAVIDSFHPVIFEKAKTDKEECNKTISRLYCIVFYMSLVFSLGTTLFSSLIIKIIYGAAYAPAVPALCIAVWYTTFSYLGPVRNIWMLNENKQKYLTAINLSGAVANIILNLCLIPLIGICGAAVASLVTQFFTNVITGFIIPQIRENNVIMLKGINPKMLKGIISEYIGKWRAER